MQDEEKMPGVSFVMRLMYLCFFSIVILFSAIDYSKLLEKTAIKLPIFYAFIIFSSVIMIFSFAKSVPYKNHYNKQNNTYAKIVSSLAKEGVKNGFSTFWNTAPIIEVSNHNISVVTIGGPFPTFFKWQNKMPNKKQKENFANFIVFDDSGWGGIQSETICMSLGEPDKKIDIDGKHIYLWNRNIAPDIYSPKHSKYISKGIDVTGFRRLLPKGFSYGPYWEVKKGSYRLKIEGQRLDKIEFILKSQLGQTCHVFEMAASSECVEVSFGLDDDVNDLEFYVKNESDKILSIKRFVLQNIDTGEERIWSFESELKQKGAEQ